MCISGVTPEVLPAIAVKIAPGVTLIVFGVETWVVAKR